MNIIHILSFAVLLAAQYAYGQVSGDRKINDGEFLRIRSYTFPAYEKAYGYTRVDGSQDAIQKYWSRKEYDEAISDEFFDFQKLIYSSDGLEVVTYVYKPRNSTAKQFPAIIFNRGSGIHKDLAPVLVPYMHRVAKKGYVVFAPMYRQSDGAGGIDSNGGDDVHDLLNMALLLKSLSYVDSENIFMSGESRGAMMTLQAARYGFPMKAAAIWGAFADIGKLFEANPQLLDYARKYWDGFSVEDPREDIEKRSVVYWPQSITIPLLIMHGERDRAIPTQHALEIAQSLQNNNRLYSLIVFADDNHILSKNQIERDDKTIEWFEKYNTESEKKFEDWLNTKANERELNNYGYDLIGRDRIDDAIMVFKLFVNRFPNNWNAYDSLGETLALNGEIEEAIRNYKMALGLTEEEEQKDRIQSVLKKLNNQ